ncbi:glycoside hydrolase family 97 catalytic domain-containing protein [Chitinophaga sp. GCM10012297]|uniref:Glycoside hydrolase family 97 catalytic domain-containing protein n=1 Tax=Chitinophaga chungangae TaxID=2821488 RepID=A0ABS3YKQ0_9BACT|nr:glycoside hydrolase family 97 protein [Chitinophaga chungangae]MBO9155268.1 glycoside hydrolase family 97 catalytic domain-containing protein [Chitinophaga chungangae]
MRPFILLFILLSYLTPQVHAQRVLHFKAPNGKLSARLSVSNGNLFWSFSAGKKPLIAPSPAGVRLFAGVLGENVTAIDISRETSVQNSRLYEVTVKGTHQTFRMEFRLFNDGCAFRYRFPGEGVLNVKEERTSFTLPASSRVWFFERNSAWKLKSYAGWWMHTTVDSLPVISSSGPVQGKPLVIQLTDKSYMAISEAALYDYSGMRLEAKGDRLVQVNFTEGNNGFEVRGGRYSPWRIVMYAEDLNSLVNNGMIAALAPPADTSLYADRSWVRPGKSVWSWITRKENYMQPDEEKRFIDAASALHFEYTLLDEGWETVWPDKWAQLKEICRYAAEKNVKVWVWRDSKWLREPAQRNGFLDSLVFCGVAGVKTDFMNSEAKALVDFEIDFLKAAAARRLMVNFHGCHAPTGENITYPNEMTREGIRGMELNNMNEPIPAWHNAALPFTRFLCGHGDYTPGFFSNKGNTTYTHQLALLYLFNSPFQCMAENPVTVINDPLYAPVIPLLQTLPVTWDETISLEGSEIGKLAALAKRKGKDWYVAVINGTEQPQAFTLRPVFLGRKNYAALVVSDGEGFAVQKKNIKASAAEKFTLPPTGGLVIRIREEQ